ncbi:uncharacterized protein HD556DRAFT_1485574 [Suillus plorans]|uniref:Uncharacterized protein n=1 Tax=Suillus plorans TaxID=116603 RepID=A0A9P7DFV3_9AGAM|nr:uncharacterized protein HD556DRAFT_1485574 [Suillus plorans]KAG1791760.1 hypothetical protein HD556DRAFT_1485574 [Suillus plorans]
MSRVGVHCTSCQYQNTGTSRQTFSKLVHIKGRIKAIQEHLTRFNPISEPALAPSISILVPSVPTEFKGLLGPEDIETPYYAEVVSVLKSIFGLTSFRQNQLEAINATLDGKDVFVLMPTSGGKVFVINFWQSVRLVGPMASLREKHVNVDCLRTVDDSRDVMCRLRSQQKHDICYITPEKLRKSNAMQDIQAHCHHLGRWNSTSVAWSADGQNLYIGALDNEIHVYDLRKGEQVYALTGHTDACIITQWCLPLVELMLQCSTRQWSRDALCFFAETNKE